MKNSRLNGIACLCLCGIFMIFYACQKEESSFENQFHLLNSKSKTHDEKLKVDVCHNNHIINISSNAVPAHQRHGDAVDMDGDGYFDMDNSCSETDCDDYDPEINPGTEGTCDNDDMSTAELLIGTWTSTEVSVEASVDGQSITEYLVEVVGLMPADAETQYELLVAELTAEVTGSLTLRSDMTFESSFNMGTDSGTWSLSSDEMTLTLFEGPDTIVIDIISISEDMWHAVTGGVIPLDVDGDPGTPDVDVAAEASVIFTKE